MAITIGEERIGSAAVIAVNGRLDGAAAPQLDDRLAATIASATALILDLACLDYASSAGLRVLLKAAKQAKAVKKSFALAAITPTVKEVFDISGFTTIFSIYPDRATAVASVA